MCVCLCVDSVCITLPVRSKRFKHLFVKSNPKTVDSKDGSTVPVEGSPPTNGSESPLEFNPQPQVKVYSK